MLVQHTCSVEVIERSIPFNVNVNVNVNDNVNVNVNDNDNVNVNVNLKKHFKGCAMHSLAVLSVLHVYNQAEK